MNALKVLIMNSEHHAKTLASLESVIHTCRSVIKDALETLSDQRKAFADLLSPNGITYYRCSEPENIGSPEDVMAHILNPRFVSYWLIVQGRNLTTEIRFCGRNYYSNGMDGPGPEEENILRARPVAVDHASDYDCHEDRLHTVYFLLVEEIPEAELP